MPLVAEASRTEESDGGPPDDSLPTAQKLQKNCHTTCCNALQMQRFTGNVMPLQLLSLG